MNCTVRCSYTIVIVSNQGGVSLKPDPKTAKGQGKRLTDFKSKVGKVMSQLSFPISLYAATRNDRFRKPRTGIWDMLLKDLEIEEKDVDRSQSLFVGDAGGRLGGEPVIGSKGKLAKSALAKKDFSCSDR